MRELPSRQHSEPLGQGLTRRELGLAFNAIATGSMLGRECGELQRRAGARLPGWFVDTRHTHKSPPHSTRAP